MPHASDDRSHDETAPDQHESSDRAEPVPAGDADATDDLTKNQGVPNDGRVEDEETLHDDD